MKFKKTAVVLVVVASALVAQGCKNPDDNKWLGAGIGAGVGVLAGRALAPKGHGAAGAIIGGLAGGVAGYAIAGGFGSKATPEQKADPAFQKANKEFDAGVEAKKSGDDAKALQHYDKAATLAPEQPEPYNNAGLIYLGQGDDANAEAMFRKALAADPNYAPAKQNLEKMGLKP
jgi:tetratricopeptide (TPR) repeat protein